MEIDKIEHQEFLLQVVQSINFSGNLEQITETAKVGQEVYEAIKNAKIKEMK